LGQIGKGGNICLRDEVAVQQLSKPVRRERGQIADLAFLARDGLGGIERGSSRDRPIDRMPIGGWFFNEIDQVFAANKDQISHSIIHDFPEH